MSAPSNAAASARTASVPNEEELRSQLRLAMQDMKKREPLDATYKRLLMNGIVTPRRPVLPKDSMYKRVGSRLRERVESFLEKNQGKDPFDVIAQRQPLEEDKMRAALTLREAKRHEQEALLEGTLAALPRRNGMDEMTRRRYLEGVALGLQSREKKPPRVSNKTPPPPSVAEQTEQARQMAELERQRAQARAREAARQQREEEERQRRDDEIERKNRNVVETQEQALHKLYQPIFKKLWDMEFLYLGGINPFRIVIDRDNCASVGAPDYFDVIDKPMNLTWIQHKVDAMAYDSFPAFRADVELMLKNAITYNSDPHNPYRIAAEEMKKVYTKLVKRVFVQQKQQQAQRR